MDDFPDMPIGSVNPVAATAAAAAAERTVVRRELRKERPRVRPADELVVGADAVEASPLVHDDEGKPPHDPGLRPQNMTQGAARLDVAG